VKKNNRVQGFLKIIGVAALALILQSGCAGIKELIGTTSDQREDLNHARDLTDRGEFTKAAEAYQSIMRKYPGSPAAGDALFEQSLLYISPKNKKKDFTKAYDGFNSFLEKYPRHQRAEMSKYLLEVLSEIKELKELLIRLEMMGRELKR